MLGICLAGKCQNTNSVAKYCDSDETSLDSYELDNHSRPPLVACDANSIENGVVTANRVASEVDGIAINSACDDTTSPLNDNGEDESMKPIGCGVDLSDGDSTCVPLDDGSGASDHVTKTGLGKPESPRDAKPTHWNVEMPNVADDQSATFYHSSSATLLPSNRETS